VVAFNVLLCTEIQGRAAHIEEKRSQLGESFLRVRQVFEKSPGRKFQDELSLQPRKTMYIFIVGSNMQRHDILSDCNEPEAI
jgi:hypothetical protein